MEIKKIRIDEVVTGKRIVSKFFDTDNILELINPIQISEKWLHHYEYLFENKLIFCEELYRYEVRANVEVISKENGSEYYCIKTLYIGEPLANLLRARQAEQELIYKEIQAFEILSKI